MKNFKTLFILAATASAFSLSGQTASDQTVNYKGEDYIITERWLDTKALHNYGLVKHPGDASQGWGVAPDFIVKNDVIYFTKDASIAPSDRLLAVDGSNGEFIGLVPIDWGSVQHNNYAAVYAGVDSENNYYVASFGAEPQSPFDIFPIHFNNGEISVSKKYTLPMNTGWWIQSVDIFGDIETGDFSAVASISYARSPVDNNYQTCICVWNFAGEKFVDKHPHPLNLTVTDVKMIDKDRIALHDRHLWYSKTGTSYNIGSKAVAKDPTLYSYENGNFSEHSSISPSTGDDGYGNGMAFFSLDENTHFMVYGSSGYTPEYKLLAVPNFPQSLDGAEELCVLIPKEAKLSTSEPNNVRLKTGVFVEKDGDVANVYVGAHSEGMAAYSISKVADINTGVENVTAVDGGVAEYYTLTGIKVNGAPSAGIYIIKTGNMVQKVFIK